VKKYHEVIIPEQTVTQLESTTCDLCHKTIKGDDWGSGDSYRQFVKEITISLDETTYWTQEGGTTTMTEFHICPECFKNKLIPWFKSQKAIPTIKETVY